MDERNHPPAGGENPEVHHETSDVNVRAIVWFGVIFVIFAILTHILLWGLFKYYAWNERRNQPRAATLVREEPRPVPEPRLQVNPPAELDRFAAEEAARLAGYSWADREKGTVRIPIDRAIDIVAQRGLPVATEGGEVTGEIAPAPAGTGVTIDRQVTMPAEAPPGGGQ
jgi:hypothetical protein